MLLKRKVFFVFLIVLAVLIIFGVSWGFGFLKLFSDANQLCVNSTQCKYGCFVNGLSESDLNKCKEVDLTIVFGDYYNARIRYVCSGDVEIQGRCAPTDFITGSCSQLPFFDTVQYQIFEENKLMPIITGMYGCPMGSLL